MAEQKAVCGGFLVGDGLKMEGKVLSAEGSSEEPVEVAFSYVALAGGNPKYRMEGYVAGKPIKFFSAYDYGIVTLYPTFNIEYDGQSFNDYYYDYPTVPVKVGIYEDGGVWYATEYWEHVTVSVNYVNNKHTIRTVLSEEESVLDVNPYFVDADECQYVSNTINRSVIFRKNKTGNRIYSSVYTKDSSMYVAEISFNSDGSATETIKTIT